MKLNERAIATIADERVFGKHNRLTESAIAEILEDPKAKYDIDESNLDAVVKMIQLQETNVNETNLTADIASFVPKIQPLLRRVIPRLNAFDWCGVQPIKVPKSEVYMLKAQYSGSKDHTADKDDSRILQLSQGSVPQAIAIGNTLTTENGTKGTVVYVEPDYSYAVVNVTTGTFIASEKLDVGATYSAGTNDITVVAVYQNEAGFRQILPGYTGTYTTAEAEALGDGMRQIRVNIVSKEVNAKSRAIKAELSIELIQDMKSMHGLSADKEILFYLETEIVNDINMEILNKYKSIAVLGSTFNVATQTASQGRWAMEMYSGLYDRILKDKRDLATRNNTGAGNILIATSGVISALESLGKFKDFASINVKGAENHSENYVGTLKDGMKVYQDWFSTDEGYVVIYKGQGAFDNGVIYAPYIPIQILNAVSAVTMQPVMAIKTRCAVVGNELKDNSGVATSNYATYRGVSFANTPMS